MKIINTRTKQIQENIFIANNLKDKSIGLLNKKRQAIFFKTRFGIHTFGINDTLFILILNNDMRLKKISKVKPNRVFLWNPFYKNVIEIRSNIFKLGKSELGDKFIKN